MELIAIGFLLGAIMTMIIFIGGVLYGGAITGDNGQLLSTRDDRIYNGVLSDSGNLESDRSDFQNRDNEEENTGAEA